MMKTLLVMGACSDMGIALVEKEANNYDRIVCQHFRRESGLDQLKLRYGDKLELMWVDLSDEQATLRFADELIERDLVPDHIVHMPMPKVKNTNFTKLPWETFQAAIDISLRSAVIVCQKILPKMTRKKGGKVVFMLTICTHNIPPKYLADYVTIKYAMTGLMKAMAVEYENKHISVNGVSPHFVDTQYINGGGNSLLGASGSSLPMGKLLSVSDVVDVMDFLLSPAGDSLSGQNIAITLPSGF